MRERLVGLGMLSAGTAALLFAPSAFAQEEAGISLESTYFMVNNTWMLVATFLVFVMHLGFACLESGLTQAKNTVNILFKNTMIISIGLLTYALCGFSLMYPGEFNGVIGWGGFLSPGAGGQTFEYADGAYTYYTDFIFQAMFAATAATIVSGAVAERVKLGSFLVFSAVYVALVYPIAGSWHWGGGWVASRGFHDFAGSTLVHSVGGWAALAGVILLGPRLGKYINGGGIKPIEGHSMPLATIGVFLLWLGWFGFNGGSVLSADAGAVSYVFVTTALAAAAGVLGAAFTVWTVSKKPDLSMALNGSLAGLVGITAGADVVGVPSAVLIGVVSGVIVVFSVITLDKLRLDDPVGAISVHLVCGIWGTLAAGVFMTPSALAAAEMSRGAQIAAQFIGVVGYGIPSFAAAFLVFAVLKSTVGIRVSEDEERMGLDIGEHGMEAYGGFQIFASR